jgi:hypothetical protein
LEIEDQRYELLQFSQHGIHEIRGKERFSFQFPRISFIPRYYLSFESLNNGPTTGFFPEIHTPLQMYNPTFPCSARYGKSGKPTLLVPPGRAAATPIHQFVANPRKRGGDSRRVGPGLGAGTAAEHHRGR